jgi:hypothetical protein
MTLIRKPPPEPESKHLPTLSKLVSPSKWRFPAFEHPLLAAWRSPSRWLLVFYALGGLTIALFPLSYFMVTARGQSLMAVFARDYFRATGETAGGFFMMLVNIVFVVATAMVVLPGILLIRRFKLKVSLAQSIVFMVGSAYCVSRMMQPPANNDANDILFNITAPTLPAAYAYRVLCLGLEAVFFLNLLGARYPKVCTAITAALPFVVMEMPIQPIVIVHSFLVVLAATPAPKRAFPETRRFWPDSSDRRVKARQRIRNASTPPPATIQAPLQPGQQYS